MNKYILILLFVKANYCLSQSINFKYDLTGNREKRYWSPLRIVNDNKEDKSTKTISPNFGISAYPNPTSALMSLNIDSLSVGESANLQITREDGSIVNETTVHTINETLDFSKYSSGIYYLKIYFREREIVYKVIKL
jgi:hypothetical protein